MCRLFSIESARSSLTRPCGQNGMIFPIDMLILRILPFCRSVFLFLFHHLISIHGMDRKKGEEEWVPDFFSCGKSHISCLKFQFGIGICRCCWYLPTPQLLFGPSTQELISSTSWVNWFKFYSRFCHVCRLAKWTADCCCIDRYLNWRLSLELINVRCDYQGVSTTEWWSIEFVIAWWYPDLLISQR